MALFDFFGGSTPDYAAGQGPTVDQGIGPQTDGTNLAAYSAATIAQPADTAGGQPASYGNAILDIFKFGVGVAQQQANQQAFFDYKKFEATSGGLYQQGTAAQLPKAAAASSSMSPLVMMAAAAIVLVVLLTHKA